jgi:hypothetical protein
MGLCPRPAYIFGIGKLMEISPLFALLLVIWYVYFENNYMSKKIFFLLIIPVVLLAAGCANDRHQSTSNNPQPTAQPLQGTFTNTKFGYSIKYPAGFQVQTFASTEAGYDLPSSPAKSDSNPVSVNKEGSRSNVTITAYANSSPLSEQSIKSGYAIEPEDITKVQLSGMQGYKVTFPPDSKIPYISYFLQNPKDGVRYEVKVTTNDPLSDQIFNSFELTN